MELRQKLQALRKSRGLSQEKLAEQIRVSRQAISKWEQGAAVPDTDNLVQLSRFFQVPIEFLLFDEYQSAEDVQAFRRQAETAAANPHGKRAAAVWIAVGLVVLVLTVCGAYAMQYLDFAILGSAYTYPLEYLRHLPLILPMSGGGVCVLVGVLRLTNGFHRFLGWLEACDKNSREKAKEKAKKDKAGAP